MGYGKFPLEISKVNHESSYSTPVGTALNKHLNIRYTRFLIQLITSTSRVLVSCSANNGNVTYIHHCNAIYVSQGLTPSTANLV